MHDPSFIAQIESGGMVTSHWAGLKPDATAVTDRHGSRTFAQVNAAANRIVRLLRRHGVGPGAHVAIVCSNRAEMMEVFAACLRGGYRMVPINWRFIAREVAHVLDDSDAAAVFVEARFPAAVEASQQARGLRLRVAIGGEAANHLGYDEALSDLDGADIPDPMLGAYMLYTSGTTGRPKGVYKPKLKLMGPDTAALYDPETAVQLCVSPTYHGSGLTWDTRTAMVLGVPVVFMDRWDSLEFLRTVQAHRVSHVHMAPIMFQRLLTLPEEVRRSFDLSSLRRVIHGAAPCPAHVKRAMIDWWGPVLDEYYGGTEGAAAFVISTEDWLRKPGSVGRRPPAAQVLILDDAGQPRPPGVSGLVYLQDPKDNPFRYYKDPDKTASAHRGDFFTLGDVGHFDEDEFLFLTGRTAECIISGGVNIYPQEIDDALLKHPAVRDCATVGVPSEEWGEDVKAVVELAAGWGPSAALAAELVAHARAHLAGYKAPKSVDFVADIPRNEAGKIERGKVRARYWEGRATQI
jgi:long-chain acyl-CoA synthetase